MKTLSKLLLFVGIAACFGENDVATPPLCALKCECSTVNSSYTIDCSSKSTDMIKDLLNPSFFQNDKNETYNITTLHFCRNSLLVIDKSFPKSNIKLLDLSYNLLHNISESVFENLQQMEELDLSNNYISVLTSEAFRGLFMDGMDYPLRSLKTLRLDHNQLHTLGPDVFEHIDRDLENLYLSNNPFKIIDSNTHIAITTITFLKVLDISDAGLKELPTNFLYTPKYLEVLNLSGNNITSIHSLGLDNAHSLKTLYLNRNPIVSLTSTDGFPLVKTLSELHLCNMPLLVEVGAHSLSRLPALEELHLSNNIELRKIHEEALIGKDPDTHVPSVQRIKKLYISNNMLTSLDLEIDWQYLTDLDIRDNPWSCECHNQRLVDTLMPIYEKINKTQSEQVICASPAEMEGKSLYNLTEFHKTMRCADLYGARPERDGTILVSLLIGLLIGIVLVLFVLYSYQRHWFGVFDSSPGAFSRQFYGRAKSGDDNDLY